jgi:hypothetical protein
VNSVVLSIQTKKLKQVYQHPVIWNSQSNISGKDTLATLEPLYLQNDSRRLWAEYGAVWNYVDRLADSVEPDSAEFIRKEKLAMWFVALFDSG